MDVLPCFWGRGGAGRVGRVWSGLARGRREDWWGEQARERHVSERYVKTVGRREHAECADLEVAPSCTELCHCRGSYA